MKHKVYIYAHEGTWMAQHTDPRIKEAFDTDTIPTPYKTVCPKSGDGFSIDSVVYLIAKSHPQYEVWEK
jgi:hypothetical protein